MSSSSLLHSPRRLYSALKTLSHRHFSASLPRLSLSLSTYVFDLVSEYLWKTCLGVRLKRQICAGILAADRDNATPGKSPSFIHPAAIVHPGAVIGQVVCSSFPRTIDVFRTCHVHSCLSVAWLRRTWTVQGYQLVHNYKHTQTLYILTSYGETHAHFRCSVCGP